jgi:DNA (cytosine-5)-methyltransferase 1
MSERVFSTRQERTEHLAHIRARSELLARDQSVTIGVLDLFAGAGGWSEGLRQLGLRDVGIEIDRWACATRAAAGHLTIRADVATYPLEHLVGRVEGLVASPPCQMFSAAGNGAGRRLMADLAAVVRGAAQGDSLDPCPADMVRTLYSTLPKWDSRGRAFRAEDRYRSSQARVRNAVLVAQPGRWIHALRPRWVALEQVPPVLPLWRALADALRQLGYSTWTGILCAADYGVPQTRKRAFLLAHREKPALPPEPTHCRGGREAGLFVPELLPWVSMAEALGWPDGPRPAMHRVRAASWGVRPDRGPDEPAFTYAPGDRGTMFRWVPFIDGGEPARTVCGNRAPRWAFAGNETTGWTLRGNQIPDCAAREYQHRSVEMPAQVISAQAQSYRWVLRSNNSTQGGARPSGLSRAADEPSLTVDSMAMQWTFVNGNQPNAARGGLHEPAPTIHFGHNLNEVSWVAERPATTVCATPRIGRPGHKDRDQGEAQFAEQSVRVSVVEAAVLQGFRADYPWQGTKTAAFRQCGDAVPPPLAAAIVRALTAEKVHA